ncbi:type IV toxin-antitoxin system AbiEi family antitoxin domain-containing protein [Antrihabitans cavernicola]|uniref:AbiEi antitoxin C-terminal domain-containing protein n=1 Tax=Antrihabitans cavernicola TaxID=2495913 RepID=A0A5A7SDJ5_9NOCA|nr:hypothetical protein [Spelaeibacter cavernicola]KAA0024220.1 hypothetical protein FOY51_06680 [Spelaeibacter cavernicola]
MDRGLPPLIMRGHALRCGYTDGELLRARRGGALQSIRRGAYVRPDLLDGLDVVEQHRLLVQATLQCTSRDAVVSHTSAAALHGIALWNPHLDRVHVTIDASSGGRILRRRHVHATPISDNEVVDVDGVKTTSVARTVVDCARTEPFEKAVVLGDSALHAGLVTVSELHDALESARGRRGAPQAGRAIAFFDGRSESVGESRSRVLMKRADLPAPQLQRVIHGIDGHAIGRVDFWFEESNTIGEFDGMAKYTAHLKPGQTAADAVRQEKLREDALRATGAAVARWTWQHLATPDIVVQRIRYAMSLNSR